MYLKSQSSDVSFLRYGVQQTEFFLTFDHFLPPRKSKFGKNKKKAWIHHHFTQVHYKQQWYVWFLRHEVQQTEYFVILGYFLPFYPTNNPIVKKMTKKHAEISFFTSVPKIIITYYNVPEIWHVSEIYCMTSVIAIFLFWLFFALLPPWQPEKRKFEKMEKKNHLEISSFYTSVPKSWLHAIMFLRYGMWQVQLLFFILGYFFLFHPPNSPKNENFKKKEKSTWRYHHFKHIYQKSWSYTILFLRFGTWQI